MKTIKYWSDMTKKERDEYNLKLKLENQKQANELLLKINDFYDYKNNSEPIGKEINDNYDLIQYSKIITRSKWNKFLKSSIKNRQKKLREWSKCDNEFVFDVEIINLPKLEFLEIIKLTFYIKPSCIR